jgi:muramoyltetrapeptide carboxypeptidase LdcA involved in peptidoglycan recycling
MNLGAQGIFDVIKGIIVGKPKDEKYYEEYKDVYKTVLKYFNKENLSVLYNINFGYIVLLFTNTNKNYFFCILIIYD